MKNLIILSILAFSSFAFAEDPVMKHQKNCDTSEARNLMGSQGSCRVVISPKPVNQQGYCSGIFADKYTCVVSYDADGSSSSVLNINCGTAVETVLNEDLVTTPVQYSVATIISNNGRFSVIGDSNRYTLFSHNNMDVSLIQSATGEIQGTVTLHFESGSESLTHVKCE